MGLLRRWAAVFLLALAPSIAIAAAPSCWPDVPVGFSTVEATAPELGDIVYAASSVGLVWGYTCKDATGTWKKVIAGGPWSAFPSDWLYIFDTALRGTNEQRKALWDKYATAAAWDDRLKPDLDAVWAKLPSPPPPPPPPPVVTWRVLADPFRADKRRVVYNAAGGKRGTATTQTIAAGEPCDPVTTITEFGPVYFLSVLGNPNLVARCVKQ